MKILHKTGFIDVSVRTIEHKCVILDANYNQLPV